MLNQITVETKEFKGHEYLEITNPNIHCGKRGAKVKKPLILRFGKTKVETILNDNVMNEMMKFLEIQWDKQNGFDPEKHRNACVLDDTVTIPI